MCRELHALGVLSVADGKYTATFAAPRPAQSEKKPAAPMRQPNKQELEADLEKRRQKELNRV